MKNNIALILFTVLIFFPGKTFSQVVDVDGNVYQTVKIGNQEWTMENLNVSRYSNGDEIPQVENDIDWRNQKTGAWCWYENISGNGNIYGRLYNWQAVYDPRGLAPEGWHIANNSDWEKLIKYLGDFSDAGNKLKNSDGWKDNGNGSNIMGFSALPGGSRGGLYGKFNCLGECGCFWSSSQRDGFGLYLLLLNSNSEALLRPEFKSSGLSVRLVKD